MSLLKTVASLTKLPITLTVTLTTGLGFLLFSGRVNADLGWSVLGTLLVAAAASALNHVQDARYDARMPRTANRPVASGQVHPITATFLAAVLAGLGMAALATTRARPVAAMALTALAMAWYNGVYAWLKRRSAFAVVPGAVIGALPPMVGWVAAGGALDDAAIWLVATLLFLWQVPHFWLLMMIHGEEYAAAGLPSLTRRFAPAELGRLTFAWMLATGVAAPLVAARVGAGRAGFAAIAAASLWMVAQGWPLWRGAGDVPGARRAFGRINVFVLVLAFTLAGGALLRRGW